MRIEFTSIETEILRHRLEASDAMWDVLADTDEVPRWTRDEFVAKCQQLAEMTPLSFSTEDLLELWIITDAVDGSVFFDTGLEDAVVLNEMSRGKFLAYRKARMSIEQKLYEAGITVTFP